MDRPRQNDHHLGVNKIGKSIRKSPLHQPNFANANNTARPQAQPKVYNIRKNEFRSIVQQLTGSPSRESLPRPPQNNPPKPQNTRLHKIRPAPLTQINRPPLPLPSMTQPPHAQFNSHSSNLPPQGTQGMMGHRDQFLTNTAESPISEYMRYLQSSLGDSGTNGNQVHPPVHEHRPHMFNQPQLQPHMPAQSQPHRLAPQQPHMPAQSQPHRLAPQQPHMMPGPQQFQPHQYQPPHGLSPSVPHNLPSPRFNGPNGPAHVMPGLPSPRFNDPRQQIHGFPSPQYNGFGPLPSPTSQFLLPSPTAYPNMFSPRSPYPLLSPGVQYPQPLTPNFLFSPMGQPGSLGPGAGSGPPQPPPSPGLMFPLSPSGFFPLSSPRWGEF